jgi:molybdopterin molybdotransferase
MSEPTKAVPSMIGFEEALAIMLERLSGHGEPPVERIPVSQAQGRVLAEDLSARWSLPAAPTSVMDGYAIRCSDLAAHGRLPLRGESAAGHPMDDLLPVGMTARVSTGAVVPRGADCVVPREDVELEPARGSGEGRDHDHVVFSAEARASAKPDRFVRAAGSDVREGSALLGARTILRPGNLALLASAGHAEIPVMRRPRVAILCTGDEIIEPGQVPEIGQIVGTNGMMLAMQIREAGGDAIELRVAEDTLESHDAALDEAMDCDLLITSGGISVGDHDLVYGCLEAREFATAFRKVRLRPGKPTTFGFLERPGAHALPVLALPGNPASTYVTFELFGRPALRILGGYSAKDQQRPRRSVTLAGPTRGNETRTHFVRALVRGEQAHPLSDQTSGALRSISGHNALLIIPEGMAQLEAGTRLDAFGLWEEG